MAKFLSQDEKTGVQHNEHLNDKDESPARGHSAMGEISHSGAPIWEQRETYGKSGTWKPNRASLRLSNALARLHGYFYLEICFSMCRLRNNGGTPLRLRVSR